MNITRFRVHVVRPVCQYLAKRRVPFEGLLRQAGLPADAHEQPFVDVPLSTLHRFHDAAARAAKDPLLGIHVGQAVTPETWDAMQLCCRSAKHAGEALHRLAKLIKLFNTWVDIGVESGPDGWAITHRIPGVSRGLSRQGNELWVAALLAQLWQMTGERVRPLQVWFGHAQHAEAEQVAAELDVGHVSFGAGCSGLLLPARVEKLPLLSADPVLLSVLDRFTENALAEQGNRSGVAALVYRALREQLDERVPPVGKIARTLAMSPRSLQRALGEEGTSYRDLVDQVRCELSRALEDRGVPLLDAAARLGYADAGSLQRARARWASR